MKINLMSICIAFIVFCTGCTGLKPDAVVSPSEVTVEDALLTVGKGLAGMKKELDEKGVTLGLLVDEVSLTLNLTSKATDSKTLLLI